MLRRRVIITSFDLLLAIMYCSRMPLHDHTCIISPLSLSPSALCERRLPLELVKTLMGNLADICTFQDRFFSALEKHTRWAVCVVLYKSMLTVCVVLYKSMLAVCVVQYKSTIHDNCLLLCLQIEHL